MMTMIGKQQQHDPACNGEEVAKVPLTNVDLPVVHEVQQSHELGHLHSPIRTSVNKAYLGAVAYLYSLIGAEIILENGAEIIMENERFVKKRE